MQHVYSRVTLTKLILTISMVRSLALADDFNVQRSSIAGATVVTIQDASGLDSFASVDSGPANVSIYVDAKNKTAESVTLTQGDERVTQRRSASGQERVIYERKQGNSEQRIEFDVDRNTNTLQLVQAATVPSRTLALPEQSGGEQILKGDDCAEVSEKGDVTAAAFSIDLDARRARLDRKDVISNCGPNQTKLAESTAALISTENQASNKLMACARDYSRYKVAVSSALTALSTPQQPLFTCTTESLSRKTAMEVFVGHDLTQGKEDVRRQGLMALLLFNTGKMDQHAAENISMCCSDSKVFAVNCRLARILNDSDIELGGVATRIILEALKAGKQDGAIRDFLFEAVKLLENTNNESDRTKIIAAERHVIELCKAKLGTSSCSELKLNEITGSSASLKPTRTQVAAIPATSKPAAQAPAQQPGAKPETTAPTPALPQLNQRITYQRNDPASVRQALKKYEYMGPLAAAARKTADSISAQVSNVAVAATDGPSTSGVSSAGFSYQSEPVQFNTGGGSISRIQVGSRSVYVKSTIPFGNRVGEPQTSVGNSPESLQPVRTLNTGAKPQAPKRVAAAGGASSAALDSSGGAAQESTLPSGGSVGPSASTQTQRMGSSNRSVSSAQQPRFKSVTEFNRALVNETNPRQFLSQSTDALRDLKLQIILRGESFPRNPDYNPRIYDFDELKRMMKR